MVKQMSVVVRIAFGALLAAVTSSAMAQSFPTKPIRLIVPYPAGGPTDAAGRYVARGIEENLGQPAVVENRPGNSGIIGLDSVAGAPADGYTLALAGSPITSYPALIKGYKANLTERLAPITLAVTGLTAIFIPASFNVSTMQELVAYSRANPGKVNFGTAGLSWTMLAHQKLNKKYNLQMTHIPYQGSSNAQVALLRSDIQLYLGGVVPFIPLVKDGKLKALTVFAKERSPLFPDAQSVQEAGLEEFKDVEPLWYGVMAPQGTPGAIINRLQDAIAQKLRSAEAREQLGRVGLYVVGSSAPDFGRQIAIDTKYWTQVGKEVAFEPQ